MLRDCIIACTALTLGLTGASAAFAQGSNSAPLNLGQYRKAPAPKKAVKVPRPSPAEAESMARQDGDIPAAETTGRGFADDRNIRITTIPVRVVSPDELNEIDLNSDPPFVMASNELNDLDRAADIRPVQAERATTGQAGAPAQNHRPTNFSWIGPLLLSVGFAFAVAIGAAAFIRRRPKLRLR